MSFYTAFHGYSLFLSGTNTVITNIQSKKNCFWQICVGWLRMLPWKEVQLCPCPPLLQILCCPWVTFLNETFVYCSYCFVVNFEISVEFIWNSWAGLNVVWMWSDGKLKGIYISKENASFFPKEMRLRVCYKKICGTMLKRELSWNMPSFPCPCIGKVLGGCKSRYLQWKQLLELALETLRNSNVWAQREC